MFFKRDDPYLLVVGMTGVKMGDRIAQVGCAHGGRLAAVAGEVGLSGRAVAIGPAQAAGAGGGAGGGGGGQRPPPRGGGGPACGIKRRRLARRKAPPAKACWSTWKL